MKTEYQWIFGCVGLSFVVSYVVWMNVRVWLFRQDLFRIRNEVWDALLDKRMLQNSAHRDFRDVVNSLIRLAPILNIFTFMRLLFDMETADRIWKEKEDDSIDEILEARSRLIDRLVRYLLLETISGLIILATLAVFRLSKASRDAVGRRLQWLFDSHSFQHLDQHLEPLAGELVESVQL